MENPNGKETRRYNPRTLGYVLGGYFIVLAALALLGWLSFRY